MSEFKLMSMEEIEKEAYKYGCEVIVAMPNQLQFDLDSQESKERFEHFYHIKLGTHYGCLPNREEWASKSGNSHVVLTLPIELGVEERIALQAMGGSDYGREFASLACHWLGSTHPIL